MTPEHDFGLTIHSIGSAIDHLKKLAASNPSQARKHTPWLARVSDELSELVAKLEDLREAAE